MPMRSLAVFALLFALSASGVSQVRGGTAVIGVQADLGHLNPAISTGSHVHAVADSLYNALIELDRDLKPQPEVARRWTVSEHGAVYTFQLASNVKWHDGTPFSSAEVKFTFDEVLLRHHARTKAGIGTVIASIDTPAADTVVFKLRKPYGTLLQLLNVTEAPILPKHLYQGSDPLTNPVNLKPVDTGPFKFESYRTDQQIVMLRNPDYFKGRPAVPRAAGVPRRARQQCADRGAAVRRGRLPRPGQCVGCRAAARQSRPDNGPDRVRHRRRKQHQHARLQPRPQAARRPARAPGDHPRDRVKRLPSRPKAITASMPESASCSSTASLR